ncbi:MAG: hypothetical protein KY469_00985 [Actinobacteria bacterium]|nr:hypothetical protein [Actinomycetota bacterium]
MPPEQPTFDRAALRRALLAAYAWLDATEVGPRSVEAGECDRCGDEARLVATCGPVPWRALGRDCATEIGLSAWCDGHHADGEAALEWLARLPEEADDVARLWWVATGEARLDPALLSRLELPLRADRGRPGAQPRR